MQEVSKLHLEPFSGGRRMTTITTERLRAFIAARQESGASNGEINRELSLLRRMFSLAAKDGSVTNRPHFPMLGENNVRTGFFEHDQYLEVLRYLPEELRPVVTFAYVTGWRIHSEILTLEWRQVDLEASVVRLDAGSTNNGRGRVLPFAGLQGLRAVLEEREQLRQGLKRRGVLCRWSSIDMADTFATSEKRRRTPVRRRAVRVVSLMICDARPCATSSVPACLGASRCRSQDTKLSPSIAATTSSTKRISWMD